PLRPTPPRPLPQPTLFPYTTLFRSEAPPVAGRILHLAVAVAPEHVGEGHEDLRARLDRAPEGLVDVGHVHVQVAGGPDVDKAFRDRKSTRLNSSHGSISYAVFCLKK